MRPEVNHDFQFGRQFLGHLKCICGEHLIGEAPFEDDTERATDLIVLRLDAVRIACRVRRAHYLKRYGDEFTIRSRRPGGHTTELTKIIEGWGDYLIYGFASDEPGVLAAWVLGDLRVFRRWLARQLWLGFHPGLEQPNGDGSSHFRAFTLAELPDDFVIAREVALCEEAA